MDKSLIKLLPYTKPYKSHITGMWYSMSCNCLALFYAYLFLCLKYFWKTRAVLTKPVYTGIGDIKQFGTDLYVLSNFNIDKRQ
jgi:subfamily B ATP-binding cassette protein MsbA